MTTTVETSPPIAAPAAEAAKPKRRATPYIVLGVVMLVTLGAVGIYLMMTAGKETTDDSQVEADVVAVATKVGGTVVRVPVKDNQNVKMGEALLQIDDADYKARVDQATAELAEASAQELQAEAQEQIVSATAKGGLSSAQADVYGSAAGVQGADAQILSAQAGLERAQAAARAADNELARAQALAKDNAIPRQQLDDRQTAADEAHAALSQAQANLSAAQKSKSAAWSRVAEAQGHLQQSAPIDAQIAAAHAATELAKARVKASEAQLALAQLSLSNTKVVAPQDGYLSKLGVHEGQLVAAGQPIGELVPGQAYVVANFKETQLGDMRPGQRATVTIDAYPHRTFEAQVESISAGTGARFSLLPADNASGNFVKVVQRVPVRIAFVSPPTDLALRAGLSADVTVYVK
jgi:membrane fusion protein (multidrug efflux system)